MKQLGLGLAVLAMSAASTAFAAAGTITFTGELVAGTCDPSVGGGASSGSVPMLSINSADLGAAAETAAPAPFKITLTGAGCTATGGKIATPFFEYEPAKVNAEGRLINTESASPADKVDIQLLNSAGAVIDLTQPASVQVVSTGVDNGTPSSKDFNYTARYYATDVTTEGKIAAAVSYSIFYK